MGNLEERIKWVLLNHKNTDPGIIAPLIVKEIEATHRIIDPEIVSEEMLDACFNALPKHYSPPDPKRRLWHGYKARHRYTAMVKAAPKTQ